MPGNIAVLAAAGARTGRRTPAATVGVCVSAAEGRAAARQPEDETDRSDRAVQNAGGDPFPLVDRADQQAAAAERFESFNRALSISVGARTASSSPAPAVRHA